MNIGLGRVFQTVTITVALGCAKNTVQQEPSVLHPVSTLSDSTARTDSVVHHTVPTDLFRPGTAVYDYRTISITRVTSGDTLPRVDTTTVTALLSATFQAIDGLTIQARLTADSIAVLTRSSSAVHFTPYIDTLRINQITGKVDLIGPQKTLCDLQAQDALIRLDDVIPRLPRTHTKIWGDTLVRQICRAGIQLQAHRVIAYQLDSSTADFQLLRTIATTFTGRGIQWNQPVESAGQSTSTDTLFLDRTDQRRIKQIRGATRLQLSFKSQLRNQQFEQLTELLVQLRR